MLEIRVPVALSGLGAARLLLADLPADLAGTAVTVDCARLTVADAELAGQVVRRLLVDGEAHELVLVDPPERFGWYVTAAAAAHGVGDRLRIERRSPRPGLV